MPKQTRSAAPASRRRLDDESGMKRTSSKKKQPPPPPSESESSVSSDSELESELEMPAKDDSRRKKKAPPPKARKGKADGRSHAIKGEQDDGSDVEDAKASSAGSKIAPHMALLLAATYHIGISSIARPSVSAYLPSAANLFRMVYSICSLLVENTKVHEMCPEFFSPVLYLYYGHAFYYHVLRARAAAGSDVLTRLEKRALTYYERVGPVESWPIASPLLGFFNYLGAHKTEDPAFSWIVPKLPNFSQLTASAGLTQVNLLHGGQRIPLIPAIQQLIYNYAHSVADFDEGILRPVGQDAADATHTFVGINASAATSAPFQSMAHNLTWLVPLETGEELGQWSHAVKRARIRRWSIPEVAANADLSTLTGFLRFVDGESFDWMKHLLRTSEVANRFFPGSGTLADVSPLTTLGAATLATYSRATAPTAAANHWYASTRETWKLSFFGFSNTETGMLDTKMSLTVSPNAHYANAVVPAVGRSLDHLNTGPFFTDDAARATNHETKATPITEGKDQIDPASRFLELISPMYDNRAGLA